MPDLNKEVLPFIRKAINNISNIKLFSIITIFTIVILCVGALIIFLSFTYFKNKSESHFFAKDTRKSHSKASEENLNQQSLTSRTAAPRSKTNFTSHMAKEKSKSIFLTHKAPKANKKIYRDPKSVDIRSSTNENAQMDNEQSPLSISGHVLNQAGEPVARIEVISIVKQLFQGTEDTAYDGRRRTTHTDGYGFFDFQDLADGEYEVGTKATARLRAAKAILRAGVNSVILVVEEESDNWVYVYGNVENTMGTPLAGVRVRPIVQAGQVTYTDDVGNYDLFLAVSRHKKSYTIRFILEGYREQRLKLHDSDVYGVDDVQLNAKMEPIHELATVTGTVIDINDVPIEGARIHLYSASLKRSFRTTSDQSGYFFLQNVEVAADYRLWVRQIDGYKDYIEKAIEVPSNGVDLTVILDPLDIASLTGQMVDLLGNPVPRFSLWLWSTYIQQSILVTSDQDGYFFIEELPAGDLSFATHSSPYFTVKGIQVSPGTNKSVLLVLDLGNYEIYGQVVDFPGNPVPGSKVSLTWFYQEGSIDSWSRRRTYTDGNGYFLSPGYRSAHQEVDVDSGEILIQLQEVESRFQGDR
jgi:protocatechuate 3,4-dioxygenase beta subunit